LHTNKCSSRSTGTVQLTTGAAIESARAPGRRCDDVADAPILARMRRGHGLPLVVAARVLLSAPAHGDVLVGLRGRYDAALTRLVARQADLASRDFAHWLAPGEFTARYAAAQRSVRSVSRWLRASGCDGVQRLRGRQIVRCRGGTVPAPPASVRPLVDGIVD